MTERLLSRSGVSESRIDYLLRKVEKLAADVKDALQRIRELTDQNGGGAANPSSRYGQIAVFRLTGDVGPMTGTTYGTGTGVRQVPGSATAADSLEINVPLFNAEDTGLVDNSPTYVAAGQDSAGWWFILTPGSCANIAP